MPSLTVQNFEGNTYEEKLADAFAHFTPRQKARLEALKNRTQLDVQEWPPIYLEKREYFQWMHQSEELEELHNEIQTYEARNKAERDAMKEANIQKGKAMAKRPASAIASKELVAESPPAKKVLGAYANLHRTPATPTPTRPAAPAAPAAPPAPSAAPGMDLAAITAAVTQSVLAALTKQQ